MIAPAATLIGTVLGTALGLITGYFRGLVDDGVSRVVDAILALPLIVPGDPDRYRGRKHEPVGGHAYHRVWSSRP